MAPAVKLAVAEKQMIFTPCYSLSGMMLALLPFIENRQGYLL
jgi:hypothetical protein